MEKKRKNICVRVDCHCPYQSDWLYYPKDIIGIHRISQDDPRAKIGSRWAVKEDYCHGSWYSQGCEEENCKPFGEVIELIQECKICSYKDKCPFEFREPIGCGQCSLWRWESSFYGIGEGHCPYKASVSSCDSICEHFRPTRMTYYCPECGSFGKCYYDEVGNIDYEDEYTFVCDFCCHTVRETFYAGSPLSIDYETYCPFCDLPPKLHERRSERK